MTDRAAKRITARAVMPHQPPPRPGMQVQVGETVRIERRDIEWPAFVFVHGRDGAGWVPARHLSACEGTAEVRVAYNTQELATFAGEVLTVLVCDDESGWLWCRAANQREGWVPIRSVELLAELNA